MIVALPPTGTIRNDSGSPARRILLIAQNLRELSSRDIAVKTGAARRLEELTPSTGELTVLAGDHNPYVRSGAVWWFRNLAADLPSDAVSALRAAMYDPNSHIVQAALGTVGVLRLDAARNDVLACLEDSCAAINHGAIFALGRMGPAEVGARLVPFLDHSESHLELAAVQALTTLRYRPAASALIARLEKCRGRVRHARSHFEMPRRLIHALVTLEAREATGVLISIAREEIGLRGMAVQALIDLRAEEAGPALLPLLQRLLGSATEEKLCTSLLYLMTAIDYRFASPSVRAFLAHKLAPVRCAALKAVCRWKDREAVPVVREMARQDASAFVRPTATAALADLIGVEALADLDELSSDANTLVRAAVAEALARFDPLPEAGQAILSRLANDPATHVSRTATEGAERRSSPQVSVSTEAGKLLPADLVEQAASARAFLARWKSELPIEAGEEQQKLEQALTTLLGVLRTV